MILRTVRRRAFTTVTLIEVVVVTGIIVVLVAGLLPAVNSVREAARRGVCVNNLMQIGIAIQNYETIHGVHPPGVVNDTGPIKNVAVGYHFGWMTRILPLIDRKAVYQRLNDSVSVYDPANVTCREVLIAGFLCPSDRAPDREPDLIASSNYAACHHDSEAPIDVTNNGSFILNRALRYDDITDGTSQTIFVGEKRLLGGEFGWASGNRSTLRNGGGLGATTATGPGAGGSSASESEYPDPVGGFSASHSAGPNYLFGDGSVRLVRASAGGQVIQQLTNRADGELLSSDKF